MSRFVCRACAAALLAVAASPAWAQTQNFDGVTAPALPPGWTTSNNVPQLPDNVWKTATVIRRSGPNALRLETEDNLNVEVTSETFTATANGRLRVSFYLRYDFEDGYDGMYLMMSTNNGPFVEVRNAGAVFTAGGYTYSHSGAFSGYWSGLANSFRQSTLDTPALVIGDQVRFRWVSFFDTSGARGPIFIDDLAVTPPPVPVPTLSEWALILFGLILAGGAALTIHRRRRAT